MPLIDRRGVLIGLASTPFAPAFAARSEEIDRIERSRLIPQAERLWRTPPRTITAIPAPRSPAGPHNYYSEGDYWWPDPTRPGGPYIRRDGLSNPDKFDGHRDALIAFGRIVPTLAAAWRLTGRARYAEAACRHMAAWLVDPATRMTPHLAHAQAIIGINTGRAIGIIDTLQIVEVARAAALFAHRMAPAYTAIRRGVEDWFAAYLDWLTTSPAGIEERDQKNNHGSCWLLQVAAFAGVVGRTDMRGAMRARLLDIIVPTQIAPDGRQPLELARTKPYGYSLFNLDVLTTSGWLLSGRGGLIAADSHGRSIGEAIAFMATFIADRTRWPFARDVEYFDGWPVRHPSLLFGARALGRSDWQRLWARLDPDPKIGEIVRNFPVRQPMLWIS